VGDRDRPPTRIRFATRGSSRVRHRFRSMLPPPPVRIVEEEARARAGAGDLDEANAPAGVGADRASISGPAHRRRFPWAQTLRRVLHLDVLTCPRCSSVGESVAMVVLAFLTDPDAVGRILRHLGLPSCTPALSSASPSGLPLGFSLPDEDSVVGEREDDGGDSMVRDSPIWPPP